MLEVMQEDHVRTARAKGLSPRLVDRRHILRNALLPVITVIGLQVGLLLSGAILTETVFAWGGLGTWIYDAVGARDYAVLQGGILFIVVVFVIVNLLVDLGYSLIDPRIRYHECTAVAGRRRDACVAGDVRTSRTADADEARPRRRRCAVATSCCGCVATRAPSSARRSSALVVVLAVFAPLIAPETPSGQAYLDRLGGQCCPGPSADYWFGLDDLGRDVFSRIVYGARVSLIVAVASVSLAFVVGGLLGAVAGYFGGATDSAIMRVADVMLAFPSFLFAIGLVALLGPGLWQLIVAIGIANVPIFARLLRGSMLGVRGVPVRLLGPRPRAAVAPRAGRAHAPQRRVAADRRRHARPRHGDHRDGRARLPRPREQRPGQPEWGAMLANTSRYLQTAPHLAFFPGAAIVITVLGFNLFGDGLREAIDPRLDLMMALLEVDDLTVRFRTLRGEVHAVNGVELSVDAGETVALVGESGCGKSVTALAILGLLARTASVTRGRVVFDGRDLLGRSERELRQLRGQAISMIFQDPMSSLNPVMTVGAQVGEVLEAHTDLRRGGDQAAVRRAARRGRHPRRRRAAPASTRTSSPAGCASGR